MKRKIIRIDEEKCTGCELCIPNCPEGAIQVIDGKARLISDLFCDGLGACLGHCPEGAIEVEEREAEPYDERRVMANIVRQGKNVVKAHLEHLMHHNETGYLKEAVLYLKENHMENPLVEEKKEAATPAHRLHAGGGCPGSMARIFSRPETEAAENAPASLQRSELTHWPIQLHLMSPLTPQYQGADVLLAADCTAFTMGDFHRIYLKGKALAIACPKLDGGQEVYLEKITALIDQAGINTLTVLIMQVPCCIGLLELAKEAAARASRKVPIKSVVLSLQGEVLQEGWV
jgi:ferredoxin